MQKGPVNSSGLRVRVAKSSAELRAAASLRAAAFADDDSTKSDFTLQVDPLNVKPIIHAMCANIWHIPWLVSAVTAPQSYRRMKANEEWDILERKIAGTEAGWEVNALPSVCHS